MLADRAYVDAAWSAPPSTSAAADIIADTLQKQTDARAFFVQPNRAKGGGRAKGWSRYVASAPALTPAPLAAPHAPSHVLPTAPNVLAVAPTPAVTPPTAPSAAPLPALAPPRPPVPVGTWANLAGNARRTGAVGGLPQCTLAAARNATRNGELTAAQFAQWCDGGDILVPYWCAFLTDCCAKHGEIAVPIDVDAARQYGPTGPRLLILQTNGGRHAVTFFVEASGDARRFDNDDLARLHGTFTWVTWDTIMHECSAMAGNATYGLVPTDSPLAMTHRAQTAREREQRRQRLDELARTGVHDAAERRRILRTEERQESQLRTTTQPPPALWPASHPQPIPIPVPMPTPLPIPMPMPTPTPVPMAMSMPMLMPMHVPMPMPVLVPVMMPMTMPTHPPMHPLATLPLAIPRALPAMCVPSAEAFASPSPPTGATHVAPHAACLPPPTLTGAQPQPHSHLHLHPHSHGHPNTRVHTAALATHPATALNAAAATHHLLNHAGTQPHPQPNTVASQPQPQHLRNNANGSSHTHVPVLVQQAHRVQRDQHEARGYGAHALGASASAASSSSAGLASVPPSSGDHHNRDERIWSAISVNPNLLACARLLSGRALLTMSDLARFARPTFDPCAFLLEHVCDSSQAAVCVTPREITPALATLIHSALVLTADGHVATLTRRPPHADSRHPLHGTHTHPFELHLLDCDPPAARPSRLIGPNGLAGAMASTLFASLCIIAPATSPIMHVRSTSSPSTIDAPPAPCGGRLRRMPLVALMGGMTRSRFGRCPS